MNFFISDALAQGAGGAGAGGGSVWLQFLPLIIIFVLFWFLLIRPQMKRAKEHKQMVAELQKGDEVITNGGMLGKITQVEETFVAVEIARDTEIRLQKHAVASVLPKGSTPTEGES